MLIIPLSHHHTDRRVNKPGVALWDEHAPPELRGWLDARVEDEDDAEDDAEDDEA